jgi:NitT/TauT family transport system substrate-binding protein
MIKSMSSASIKKSMTRIALGLTLWGYPSFVMALETVVFATDWKAQAEQGGFYQAKAMGLYEKAGLNVRIHGGGPGINIPQLLGAGAIDFGMGSNSFIPLNMVRAGVPAKAVMAAFQKDPQVLITHPRDDVKNLDDMQGKPIMIADATIGAFWVWLKAKFGFENSQIRKYTFNLAPFLVDKTAIQQGYVTSEPFTIETIGGVKPQVFLLSDYGYPGYAAMILARNTLIDERPELVTAFVTASIEGWTQYLYGDAGLGDTLIKASNPEMTDAQLAFARQQMRDRQLVLTPEAEKNGIGTMTEERWKTFFDIMSEQGIYPKDLNWREAFTTRFLPPQPTRLPADR